MSGFGAFLREREEEGKEGVAPLDPRLPFVPSRFVFVARTPYHPLPLDLS